MSSDKRKSQYQRPMNQSSRAKRFIPWDLDATYKSYFHSLLASYPILQECLFLFFIIEIIKTNMTINMIDPPINKCIVCIS